MRKGSAVVWSVRVHATVLTPGARDCGHTRAADDQVEVLR
jgi:hypothetical protein